MMNFSVAVIHGKPCSARGLFVWQIPAICFIIQLRRAQSVSAGTSGRGSWPYRSTAFLRKGGVEGIGILGAIVKQTNQKKKGEWMNG
jgi:hypothetical protein